MRLFYPFPYLIISTQMSHFESHSNVYVFNSLLINRLVPEIKSCTNASQREGKCISYPGNVKLERYECLQCNSTFATHQALSAHSRSHFLLRPFVCPFNCDKRYAQKSSLKAHIRSHTGDRPFVCPDCGKTFSRKPSMKRHQMSHSGIKPFSCQVCEKSFSRKDVLLAHMQRTHMNEDSENTAME